MKLRINTYYYICEIYRGGKIVPRQGTIHAETPNDAIDEVYTMAEKVWKRTLMNVSITHPQTAVVLAKSTVKDRYQNTSPVVDLPNTPPTVSKTWHPSSFGTYLAVRKFPRLVTFE